MINNLLIKINKAIESLAKSILPKPSIEGIVVKYLDFNDLDLADKVQYLIILYKD